MSGTEDVDGSCAIEAVCEVEAIVEIRERLNECVMVTRTRDSKSRHQKERLSKITRQVLQRSPAVSQECNAYLPTSTEQRKGREDGRSEPSCAAWLEDGLNVLVGSWRRFFRSAPCRCGFLGVHLTRYGRVA